MNQNLARGLMHYQQHRLDMAEQEFRQSLAREPDHPLGHGFLAMCLADQEKYDEATQEARTAVHLGPDDPSAHYALAYVLEQRNRLEEARAAIQETIRLEPDDAENWSRLGAIELQRRDWTAALAAAEQGLQFDAEHDECTNLRATALVKLGRRSEAGAAIEAALQRDPENAVTHANMGWTLLHANEPKAALEHFREALRLEPNMEFARAGIVEAMKARHAVYRYLLMYFLWMSRLSHRAQWGVIIGLYVLRRILGGIADRNPELEPFLAPVLILYMVFALLTWIGGPLFNLLLRFNRFGRYALSEDEIRGADVLAVCLGIAVVSLGLYFWRDSTPALLLALVSGAMAVPLSAVFNRPAGWPRNSLAAYAALLGIAGIVLVATSYLKEQPDASQLTHTAFGLAAGLFAVGWLLFGWVANALAMARVRR